jgi:hypothetical protein
VIAPQTADLWEEFLYGASGQIRRQDLIKCGEVLLSKCGRGASIERGAETASEGLVFFG